MSDKGLDDKINRLSMLEQNGQYLASQRQGFQNQMLEIDSALEELDSASDSFKIIGNIMVKQKKDDLKKELKSKKEIVDIRIKSIEKQEEALKEKSHTLREDVMKKMKAEKSD